MNKIKVGDAVTLHFEITTDSTFEQVMDECRTQIERIFANLESEDERTRKAIIAFLQRQIDKETFGGNVAIFKRWIAYLEKQKEQKPSTEETELNSIAFLEQMGYTCIPPKEQQPSTPEDIAAAYQMGLAKGRNEQKPAEWSEGDELMRNIVLNTLERIGDYGTIGMQKDWLKSLRPQPHWKPSKRQMEALHEANIRACSHNYGLPLSELEIELQNLM